MEPITYRRRIFHDKDIELIRQIIERHSARSRRFISKEVCKVMDWKQPNGILRDMTCRTFLLQLHRKGIITLPACKQTPANPLAHRKKAEPVLIDQTLIQSDLKDLKPITSLQVRRTQYESLFNSLIEQHHYLGYTQPVGEHLKYIFFSKDRPIACLTWSSAPWYIGVRDRYIGWSSKQRQEKLHYICNNTRFLILPWVNVAHLASYLLARCRKIISLDYERLYYHPIYFVETFVDTERFRGTCYRADNWIYLGLTTGRGKLSRSAKPSRSKKAVYGFSLVGDFRSKLCESCVDNGREE